MKASIIDGTLAGEELISEYWAPKTCPVIEAKSAKPVFHESGYASGHANEALHVPGLLDWFKAHADQTHCSERWGWVRVRWSNKTSDVFLHLNYDGAPDVYHMSN